MNITAGTNLGAKGKLDITVRGKDDVGVHYYLLPAHVLVVDLKVTNVTPVASCNL